MEGARAHFLKGLRDILLKKKKKKKWSFKKSLSLHLGLGLGLHLGGMVGGRPHRGRRDAPAPTTYTHHWSLRSVTGRAASCAPIPLLVSTQDKHEEST